MAGSAAANVWPRLPGSGPVPIGGGLTGLPSITNPNLPSNTTLGLGNLPPPIPQPPTTPFPSIRPALGPTNPYPSPGGLPPINLNAGSLMPSPAQVAQSEANQRRMMQLEDENSQRRLATANLTQLGSQLIQGQMDVQEQVLQYQFMLEQCMEMLDHQNYILNEQAEELSLQRAKMRHLEYLMDAFKYSKDGARLLRSTSGDASYNDNNFLCCGDPISLPPPSTSPFFAGGPTRVTASTFQPFNPRYRSPTSRAATAAQLNQRRSTTPSVTNNRNLPNANNRPSRRI